MLHFGVKPKYHIADVCCISGIRLMFVVKPKYYNGVCLQPFLAHVHCMFAICPPYVCRMFLCSPTICHISLYVRHMSAICPPYVRHMSAICPLYVRRISAISNHPFSRIFYSKALKEKKCCLITFH